MAYKAILCVTILLFLCGYCSAGYTDCGSEHGSIVSLEISDCAPNAKRCILRRNTNSTMTISFSSTSASNSLKAVVHGVILGVPVPFDLPNPDGCKDSGISCPLQPGTTYKYSITMPILGSYPMVTVDIKWELRGDDDKDIFCALIPARIR